MVLIRYLLCKHFHCAFDLFKRQFCTRFTNKLFDFTLYLFLTDFSKVVGFITIAYKIFTVP